MLTINKLSIRAKFPRRLVENRTLIDRVAREDFPSECSRQLKGRWRPQNTVTRIRRLQVRVSLPANELRPDALAAAWTNALLRELFAALSCSNDSQVLHFESRAHYLVAAIRESLSGGAAQRWAYEEVLPPGAPAAAALKLLARERSEIVPVLLLLEVEGLLDRLAVAWGNSGLQQLFLIVSGQLGARPGKPSIDDLLALSRLVLADDFVRTQLRTAQPFSCSEGRIGLTLFLRAVRGSGSTASLVIHPEVICQAIRILQASLEWVETAGTWRSLINDAGDQPGVASDEEAVEKSDFVDEEKVKRAFNALLAEGRFLSGLGLSEPLRELKDIFASSDSARRRALVELIAELTARSDQKGPGFAEPEPDISRVELITSRSTGCAGLFLLTRMIKALGWEEQLAESQLASRYGPRLLTYTLAGVALTVLDRFVEEPTYLDSGLALFAGWIAEPDLGGLRAFLRSNFAAERRDLLRLVLGPETSDSTADSWLNCFNALAERLIREFSANLRYLGDSSRVFVVRNFIALPGYIRVEDERLVVSFASNPLQIVLHFSGLDEPIPAVSWFGGRSVHLQSESA